MTTSLRSIDNGVNLLEISGVTLLSLEDVNAWLFAIDMPPRERKAACRQILADGYYAVSNIEHRVTVVCEK